MKRRGVPAHLLGAAGLVSEALLIGVEWPLQLDDYPWAAFTLTTLAVGWILAWKRPAVPVGRLMLAAALIAALQGPATVLGVVTAESAPEVARWAFWCGVDSPWVWILPIGLLVTQVPLRLPEGALPSPGWRWVSAYAVVALAVAALLLATLGPRTGPVPNPTFVAWGGSTAAVVGVGVLLLASAAAGCIASLLVRYRRADPVGRTQLRWIFWAIAVVAALLVLGGVGDALFGGAEVGGAAGAAAEIRQAVTSVGFSLIPLAILFAVLRTGLYAIDRIISRTAAYAVVTLVVLGVYGVVVLLVSLVLPHEPGQPTPPVVIALATLAAAAVFLPALRWIRRIVDRVFNRSQYDAERVVEAFGERIRNGADPHMAGADLLDAVGRTLQPSAAGIWTREPGG